MLQFDTLEIQKNIEEKRLVLGKKFENFLIRNFKSFFQKIDQFLCAKNFCFWSVSTIFLFSIYLRSLIDIGGDSAAYIDIAAKMFRGGKYYYDFFEGNFPLSFWIHLIPYSVAKILNISPIITAEIFVNLLGLSSLIFSAKILKKSELKRVHQNLLITSFALGFFLRIYALDAGEFLTKTSFLLCFFYPYLAFSFSRKTSLSKKEILCRGLLGGLIPCVKPHYIFLPLLIEANRFWKKKSANFFIELDKFVMCLVGAVYLLLMLKFTPEFFEFMLQMWSDFYLPYSSASLFFLAICFHLAFKIIFFGGIFFVFLRQKFSEEDKILFLVFIAASLILTTENLGSIDQRACFFALIIPVFTKIFYDFLKSGKINFNEGKIIFGIFLFFSIIDPESLVIISEAAVMCCWIAIPFFIANLLQKFKQDKIKIDLVFGKKINQKTLLATSYAAFVLLLIIAVNIAIENQVAYAVSSILLFFIFLFSYEKTHAKFYKNFSTLFVSLQFFLASTLIALLLSSETGSLKSPNHLTDQISRYAKFYLAKSDDRISIWSLGYPEIFPYLGKENPYVFHSVGAIYLKDQDESYRLSSERIIKYFSDDLKMRIKDKNMKIIFVNNVPNILNLKHRCVIGFLENSFQDEEFKKTFLQNYKFVGRFFESEIIENKKQISFFSTKEDVLDKADIPRARTIHDFEIYARKNN
jgi:hypothetical protein